MRTCTKCGRTKAKAEFHRDVKGREGIAAQCKQCRRAANDEWKRANPERFARGQKAWVARNRERVRESNREYRKRTPGTSGRRKPAHDAVRRALTSGELVKPPACEQCADVTERLDAHHDDYAMPLAVRWLCRLCHRRHHAQLAQDEVRLVKANQTETMRRAR